MKLNTNQSAPSFNTRDVFGNNLNLQEFKGRKVFLAFERNAGCPVCNLRIHELLKQAEVFKTNGVTMIFIYESTEAKMKEYLGENTYPFHFVADPENRLYNIYGVERSFLKVLKSMFHGLFEKVKKGTSLFAKPMKQDGHMDRIPAEFLVDERGRLIIAHYGKFIGDHISVTELLRLTGVSKYENAFLQ